MGEAKRRKEFNKTVQFQNKKGFGGKDGLSNTLSRDSDLVVSVKDSKERDRLVEMIKNYIRNNPNKPGWMFPMPLYNLQNLAEAAGIVRDTPEFSHYHYSFSTKLKSDTTMGYVAISKEPL